MNLGLRIADCEFQVDRLRFDSVFFLNVFNELSADSSGENPQSAIRNSQ